MKTLEMTSIWYVILKTACYNPVLGDGNDFCGYVLDGQS